MILTTFLHQSENPQILMNLWLKSTTSFFMKTRLLLNVFLLVNNLHLIYVDCKQVANVIKAMPSNKAPGIDTPFDYVNHQCFSFSFNRGGGGGTEKRCYHNLQSGHPAWWSADNCSIFPRVNIFRLFRSKKGTGREIRNA